ncbi:MAG: Gfo/Idh/MocA family protein [Spirochaetia bacterium]
MVKVAVVGAGFIGEVHAGGLSKLDNADITAVVSGREKEGKEFADKYGARHFSTLKELLKEGDVDCVDLCTPTFTHPDMVVKSAEAGKHILCEKPLALTLKDADRMIKAVQTNKVKAMAGHTLRFWPEYIKAKQIIDSGELGKPLYALCERLAVTPDWHKNSWGFDESKGGGASVDLHIHDLDYLIWLFGQPKQVSATGVYKPELGGVSHIGSNIVFQNGVTAFAEGGWTFKGSFPFTMTLRVLCEKGTVEWILRAGKNIEERASKMNLIIYKPDGTIEEPEVEEEDPYFLECKYFVDCIDKNQPIENGTFEDGRNALELALAATKSAKEQKTVKL